MWNWFKFYQYIITYVLGTWWPVHGYVRSVNIVEMKHNNITFVQSRIVYFMIFEIGKTKGLGRDWVGTQHGCLKWLLTNTIVIFNFAWSWAYWIIKHLTQSETWNHFCWKFIHFEPVCWWFLTIQIFEKMRALFIFQIIDYVWILIMLFDLCWKW